MIIAFLLATEDHGLQLLDTKEELFDDEILLGNLCFQVGAPLFKSFHSLLPLRFQQTIISPLNHPAINFFLGEFLHAVIVNIPSLKTRSFGFHLLFHNMRIIRNSLRCRKRSAGNIVYARLLRTSTLIIQETKNYVHAALRAGKCLREQ